MDLLLDTPIERRLVVLLPGSLASSTDLARQIHRMATPRNLPVLYLVLVDARDNLLAVARDMATMKAVTADNRLRVETRQVDPNDWFRELSEAARPGDVIVCQQEQTVLNGFLKAVPLGDLITEHLNLPVRTLAGYYHPYKNQVKYWLRELIGVLGFVVIIAAFTWLEIQFDMAFDGAMQSGLILFAFVFELGAVFTWHKLAYR